MSFFDNAVSAAKTVGKSVGRRAEEIIIISKKKLEAIELENKLTGLYERLGKIYYLDFEGTAEDLAEEPQDHVEIIEDIKRVTICLDVLRAEIEDLSKTKQSE